MNKEKRDIYLQLATMRTPLDNWASGLCNFCKHAKFTGGGCCTESDLECHCGIEKIEENAWETWAGDDCWAFRPEYPVDTLADMVGLALTGIYPEAK